MSVLLNYQREWIALNAKVKVAEKSRRTGFTWAEAAYSSLVASRSGKAGKDTWYIAVNEAGAQEFILDAAYWAKTYNMAAGEITKIRSGDISELVLKDEDKDILAYQIRFASGRRVTGLTSSPTNLRGKQGRVVADEFAFHPDQQGLLKAAMALLMWGGQICLISTHNGVDNLFNKIVMEIRSGQKSWALQRVTLDDALRDGLFQRICLTTDEIWSPQKEATWRQELVDTYGDDAEEELFCNPRSVAQVYLPSMLVEAHMSDAYPVVRLELKSEFVHQSDSEKTYWIKTWLEENVKPLLLGLDKSLRHYFGEDFGRNADLTVFAPIAEQTNLNKYFPFLIELRNVPFKQQEQILEYFVEGLPNFSGGAMDARGNGQALAEWAMNKWGEGRIEEVKLSNGDYGELSPLYKKAIEDGTIKMPKDADVLADHRSVRVINGVAKVPETSRYKEQDGGTKSRRHGDAYVAMLLAYAASRKHPVVTQSQPQLMMPLPNSRFAVRDAFGIVGTGRGLGRVF